VFGLALGRLAQVFLLDPLTEQRKVIGKIDYALTYLAPWYGNPVDPNRFQELTDGDKELIRKHSETLRHSAALLYSTTNAIVCYRLWARLSWVPSGRDVREAGGKLILLCNALILPVLVLLEPAALEQQAALALERAPTGAQ
jgi:hypothetical protein